MLFFLLKKLYIDHLHDYTVHVLFSYLVRWTFLKETKFRTNILHYFDYYKIMYLRKVYLSSQMVT